MLTAPLLLLLSLPGCAGEAAVGGAPGDGVPSGDRAAAVAPRPFLRVLGTAQDGGFPHAACDCSRCRLARSGEGHERLVASLAVVVPAREPTAPPRVYLIDATPDLRRQLDRLRDVRRPPDDRVDRAPVDGVFLTHAHIGHYLGLAFLGFEAVHTRDLPVHASASMISFLRSNAPWDQLVALGNISPVELRPDEAIDLSDGVAIRAFPVPHRDEYTDTVGYRITGPERTVMYVPDTDPWRSWSPSLIEALEGVDVALLDGAFWSADELPGRDVEDIRHPLVIDSMRLLRDRVKAGLDVRFTHLNHSNPLLDRDSEELRELEAAGFSVLAELDEIGL